MLSQTRLKIEWEGELSDEDVDTITDELTRNSDVVVQVGTEKSLAGIDLIISTIVIAMATKAGEKLMQAAWSAIASLRKTPGAEKTKTVTIDAEWEGGKTTIKLPLGDARDIKKQLLDLTNLIEHSK
ncbi:hypothetical protein [uncultured Desulfobacter sp.]|uniref:hypothetical protein n=1 Tax=uncultured Desulfobacter sp. TaxID=240139 RepID=UPI0029C6655C|nr:hypothetical protein [uncultured Desulfobacter sp.]